MTCAWTIYVTFNCHTTCNFFLIDWLLSQYVWHKKVFCVISDSVNKYCNLQYIMVKKTIFKNLACHWYITCWQLLFDSFYIDIRIPNNLHVFYLSFIFSFRFDQYFYLVFFLSLNLVYISTSIVPSRTTTKNKITGKE